MGILGRLRLSDVESVFNLVSECRELWADARAWQTHLLHGACRLTRTAAGHYNEQVLAPDLRSTRILDEIDLGWRDAAARECVFRVHREHPNRAKFFPRCTRLAARALHGQEATALRAHIRDDDDWYRSAMFNEYRRPGYVDGFVMSFSQNPQTGALVMIVTNQDRSDRPPTPRAAAMLSLLTRRIAPLVGTVLTTSNQRGLHGLSPRLRQTLDALLAGDSEKQIAARLSLHPTTVHDYVGALYRHFAVGSRGELMAYFLRRRPPQVELQMQ
jgi:DNA-binding CsgD family transcriptional regulator